LAQNEEVGVEKNLKELKKINPLSYGFEVEITAGELDQD